MLSRTASNLYWIGRYMERAEFTTRLVEATIRLSSLSTHVEEREVWESALAVVGESAASISGGEAFSSYTARRHLALSMDNPGSIKSCLFQARENARAARNLLTREVWEAINCAWLTLRDRSSPHGTQGTLNLIEQIKTQTRGFEGALARMLRTEAYWFMRLGSMIERGDNTARLLDVKYYLLLPQGQEVGGRLDRDQWMTLLQVVSGQTAYRLIYKQALRPWLVADLLIYRPELPRSLAAATAEAVQILAHFGTLSGRQGEADRRARKRLDRLEAGDVDALMKEGLHETLNQLLDDNAALDRAIVTQFRFP